MFRTSAAVFFLALAAVTGGEPKAPARADRHGDPLPDEAVARLGTLRWRQPGGTSAVAFSPDGKILAAGGSDDDGISLWEVATGKELRRCLGHKRHVTALAFSGDGKTLGSAGDDRAVRLWDAASGKEVRKFPARGSALAFSPDGKTMAYVVARARPSATAEKFGRRPESDAIIHLTDVKTGKEIRQIECARTLIDVLAFSPDGKKLASGHRDDPSAIEGARKEGEAGTAVRLWDVATGKQRGGWGDVRDIRTLAFSPDGKTLASGHDDKSARLWDAGSGKELRRLDAGARPGRAVEELYQLGRGVFVAFSGDGKTLVSACEDRTVLVWDAGTGRAVHQLPDQFALRGVTLSAGGRLVVAGGLSDIRLSDARTGKAVEQPEGHRAVVRTVAFSPDGKTLATASGDIRLWEATTGKQASLLPGAVAVAFSPDGKTLACGGDQTLLLRAADTGKELRRFPAHHRSYTRPATAAFSPDGKFVAAEFGLLGLREVATGKERPLFEGRALGREGLSLQGIDSIAFAPDGGTLAWAVGNQQVRLLQLAPRQASRGLDQVDAQSVAFSPDGNLLAAAGGRNFRRPEKFHVYLWEADTGRLYRKLGEDNGMQKAVAFAPDGRSVASGGADGTVRLWEVASGELRHQFRGHRGPVWCVAFSPDGRTVASGSQDTTVLVWEAAGVSDRRAGARLTAERLEALWSELKGEEAGRAFGAVRSLAAVPADAVPFLQKQLRALYLEQGKSIARLIVDLDKDDFATREKATAALEKLGDWAEPAMRRALVQKPSAEVRRRLVRLLEGAKKPVASEETLRSSRALEVLESIGTGEARRALNALAEEMPATRAGSEARESVKRLNRRAKRLP